MSPLRIGVQLSSLKLPFRQALTRAAAMGVRWVELDARGELKPRELSQTAVRQIRQWLNDCNLQVCAVGFRTRRGYEVADDLQARIDATKEAMRLAYALGASLVVNQVGQVPPADEQTAAWQTMIEALADLGDFGQRTGVTLAAETGSESGADLARLMNALPNGALAVTLDPGNLVLNGFSVQEAVESLGAQIRYVHAKDAVRDLAQRRSIEVQLGRGSVDFPALLGALEEFGYRGVFTVERERPTDPVAEISLAVEYLRNL